jgi:hypothetical protein
MPVGVERPNAWVSRFVWTDARVTPRDLWSYPPGLAAVLIAGGLMGLLDFRSVFLFARFDRPAVEVPRRKSWVLLVAAEERRERLGWRDL